MSQYTKEMGKIAGLIDFLYGARWDDFCKEASKYHPGIAKGSTTIKLAEVKQQFIFDAFSSIVNLISYFSAMNHKKKLPSYKVILEVNEKLDQMQREDALFRVLRANNDEVKLAVMECLNNVPLEQFSSPEIAKMVSLLTAFKNPTTGIIEIVLGKIFWLLSKIVSDESDKVGKMFRKTQARTAVKECIGILEKNQDRLVRGKEQDEKVFMAVSAVYFLQSCSKFPELSQLISEYSDSYFKLLKSDEKSQEFNYNYYPLEVERTAMGSTIHNNLNIFLSIVTLDQYSDVCLRVLQTIADITSFSNNGEVPEMFSEDVDGEEMEENPMDAMKRQLSENMKKRKEQEEKPWIDLQEARKQLQNNMLEREKVLKNINEFIEKEMLDILLNYLAGNCAHRCVADLDIYLRSFSAENLKLDKLRRKMEKEMLEIKRRLEEKISAVSSKEKVEERKDVPKPTEIIVNELKKEPLAYMKIRSEPIIDRGISIQGELGTNVPAASSIKDIEYKGGYEKTHTFTNKKQRALTLAAFMRSIYNVYAYSDAKGKSEILRKMREKNNLKILTQLVFTTDWLEANIGAKYLRLCRLVLKIDPKLNYAPKNLLELNEIACTAAREMLQFMFNRFKNEDKIPFTERENLLLSELAAFGRCICTQVPYLPYSVLNPNEEEKANPHKGITPGMTPEGNNDKPFIIPPWEGKHGPDYMPSLQYLYAEYTLSQLLPYKSMYTFTLMLFYFARKLEEIRSDPKIVNKDLEYQTVEEARAATVRALGSYMSLCKKEKRLFFEEIMKQCIYEKKYIRKSYIQEILSSMHQRLTINAIVHFQNALCNRKNTFVRITAKRIKKKNVQEMCMNAALASNFHSLQCKNRQGTTSLKQASVVLTVRAVYFFKPFAKECKLCPIEKVCWEPSVITDPIPLKSIQYLIDMEQLSMLALAATVKGGVLSMGGDKTYLIQLNDHYVKKDLINKVMESCAVSIVVDPVFKEIVPGEKDPDFCEAQIVGISLTAPIFRESVFSGQPRIPNPYLMILSKTYIKFYKVNYASWTFTGDIPDTPSSTDKQSSYDQNKVQLEGQQHRNLRKKLQKRCFQKRKSQPGKYLK
eukprot:TRINITY_DN378_c0_g1_i1.p2 TRINITY_DN378_c0_g1~~TRINITY_DN378_c0_g1_i1.p2  ORF type:complete len:1093 (-),score=111.04 TRINITY_DN378_c0_g1_i1:15898-19176(-)